MGPLHLHSSRSHFAILSLATILLGVILIGVIPAQAQAPTINTYAGGGLPAAGPATATGIGRVRGLARDTAGNFYFHSNAGVILKMDSTGNLSVFAGNGTCCFSGDGGPATSATLSTIFFSTATIFEVKTDAAGNVYFADALDNVVRRVDAVTGLITTVAGTPNTRGFSGDGAAATNALLNGPVGLAISPAGDVFIADQNNAVVRRVDHITGFISTVAGNFLAGPGFSGDTLAATSAQLNSPAGLALDAAGNLFISDLFNRRVRRVDAATQNIDTIAGGGPTLQDNVLATQSTLSFPAGLAFDTSGTLFIADLSDRIRRVDGATQIISTVAGGNNFGFSGDNGLATSAQLNQTSSVVVDPAGNLFFSDENNYRVRRVDFATGVITTVAGNGTVGDGSQATSAMLAEVAGVVVDPTTGNLLVSDSFNNRVRRVNASTGVISTAAGTGVTGSSGDGAPAIAGQIGFLSGLAVDGCGNFFIADQGSAVERRVDASTGFISTVAGTNFSAGFSGDGGLATAARLNLPQNAAVDATGNLFIADSGNNVIRRVDASTQNISTVAGNFPLGAGFGGDGGLATAAQLNFPIGVAGDGSGNLFIADTNNNVIRRVDAASGKISTVAGNFALGGGFSGDGGLATSANCSRRLGSHSTVLATCISRKTPTTAFAW